MKPENEPETKPKGPAPVKNRVILSGTDGPLKLNLVAPASLGLRLELREAAGTNLRRAFAAALGHCSTALRQRGGGRPTPGPDHMKYGAALQDYLLSRGVSWEELGVAGSAAWMLCTDGLPDYQVIEEVEDFSDPPEDDSTS